MSGTHGSKILRNASISSFVQRACAAALAYDISSEREVYRRRRDYVCTRLDSMGLPYFKPQGAFYVFPSIAAFGMDSLSFCSRMVKEGKLACTPGSCFGAEGFLRISYCYSDDVLREGTAWKRLFKCCAAAEQTQDISQRNLALLIESLWKPLYKKSARFPVLRRCVVLRQTT